MHNPTALGTSNHAIFAYNFVIYQKNCKSQILKHCLEIGCLAHATKRHYSHQYQKFLHIVYNPKNWCLFSVNVTMKSTHCIWSNSLGPLHIQDKMIIAKAWYTSNCTGCIFPMVKIDECKTLNITATKTSNNNNNHHHHRLLRHRQQTIIHTQEHIKSYVQYLKWDTKILSNKNEESYT